MDHRTATLEPRYFERMAAALGDKRRLLEWVLPGAIADVGAGGGQLAAAVAAMAGVTAVYALDSHPDAYRELTGVPGIRPVRGSFGEHLETLPAGRLDTIICSSVLHEVYSYGGRRTAWDLAVDSCAAALRPGGRLIIRDGVMPERPDAPATMVAPDDALVAEYLDRSPWRMLHLTRDGRRWRGSSHAVSEALLTLTWGVGSLPREAQERYQLDTVGGYAQRVCKRGFRVLHAEAYTQPEYVEHLADFAIEREQADGSCAPWFPPTNAIWVFERN